MNGHRLRDEYAQYKYIQYQFQIANFTSKNHIFTHITVCKQQTNKTPFSQCILLVFFFLHFCKRDEIGNSTCLFIHQYIFFCPINAKIESTYLYSFLLIFPKFSKIVERLPFSVTIICGPFEGSPVAV